MAPDITDKVVTSPDGLERLTEFARNALSPKERARLENSIRLVLRARQVVSDAHERAQRARQYALTAAASVKRLVRETARYKDELQIIKNRTPK